MSSDEFVDYYRILNILPTVSAEKVHSAYIAASKKYHPDVGGTVEQMKMVNEAYEVLNNPELRIQYDQVYARYQNYKESERKSSSLQDEINNEFQLIKQAKKVSKEMAKKGAIWFTIGTVATIATYSAASDGGTYFVAWGPMVFGGYQLLKGLYLYFNPHALLKKAMGKNAPQNLKSKAQGTKATLKMTGIAVCIFIIVGIIAGIANSGKSSSSSAVVNSTSSSTTFDQARAAYDQCVAEYNTIKTNLDSINSEMETYKNEDDADSYNALVPQQNGLYYQGTDKYNQCEALRNSYNQSVSSASSVAN